MTENSTMLDKIAIIIQLVFAGLLVWATFLLAKYTKVLARITKRMVVIEEERDKKVRDQKRLMAIENLLLLSEKIVVTNAGYYGGGLFPGASTKWDLFKQMKEMALLKKHIDDEDTVKSLEELIRYIQTVDAGTKLEETVRLKAINSFEKFQKRLIGLHLDKWREELTVSKDV